MPQLKITLTVEVDSQPVAGFPIVRRTQIAETQQFEIAKAADNDVTTFTALQMVLAEVNALLIRPDLPINLRFNNQTDAGIKVNAGGLLLLFDGKINSGATTNVKINNPDAALVATLRGLVAGP